MHGGSGGGGGATSVSVQSEELCGMEKPSDIPRERFTGMLS